MVYYIVFSYLIVFGDLLEDDNLNTFGRILLFALAPIVLPVKVGSLLQSF